MNLFSNISKLFLTAVVACLSTGCSPTDSQNVPSPVANEDEPKENVTKKISIKKKVTVETGAAETDAAESLSAEPSEPEVVNDLVFHDDLVAAANEYLEFGMVNSSALAAPADCAPASESRAAQPQMSQSDDESTHGNKLYYLFAKEVAHYLNQDGSPTPTGQVLVKESWTSKPSNPNARNLRNHASGNRINPRTKIGDEILEIGRRKELFVMLKLDSDTAGTDQGWVYGIVDPETKLVTESGKVPSCIRCHRDAKHDRMLGPANLSF